MLVLLISRGAYANNDNKSQILLDALWKEIYGESLIVDNGPTPGPTPVPTPEPVKKDDNSPPVISKGEQYVQDTLKHNRELLKQKREQEKLDGQKKAAVSDNPKDFYKEMKEKQDDFIKVSRKDVQDTYAQWEKEKQKFLGRIDEYKKNLVDEKAFSVGSVSTPSFSKKNDSKKIVFGATSAKISDKQKYDYHVVKGAFELPIRDQGQRPTCASFAGVRAMEVLLRQQGRDEELSEQYFYWASKPDCQGLPCDKKGSWDVQGYDFSKSKERADIPRQTDCPYINTSLEKNETQIPLSNSCLQMGKGIAKVASYSYAQGMSDIIAALKRDKPVVGGFRLSEEFYKTQGLVTGAESGSGAKLNEHALGHALLIVGYMQMPAGNKQAAVGDYCLIVANSWGEGYGKGGHACLGEKWLKKYRFEIPFVVLESVQI
jgi:C1A family cysteine protease